MKKINTLFLCFFFLCSNILAQEKTVESNNSLGNKIQKASQNFYIIATVGTPTLSLGEVYLKSLKQVLIGELTIGYKINDRLSFGLSSIGGLSNCNMGYYDIEGNFFELEDEDNNDEHEEDNDLDDEDGECEDELDNLLGGITYHFGEHFFAQAGGGYSFSAKSPALTASLGYKHDLFSNVGLVVGIRYNNVLKKMPVEATKLVNTSGLKLELGLSWNL